MLRLLLVHLWILSPTQQNVHLNMLLLLQWKMIQPEYGTQRKSKICFVKGQILDINDTVSKLGDECSDLLALCALSGYDTVQYPFSKGKVSAINSLLKSVLNLKVFSVSSTGEIGCIEAGTNLLSCLCGGMASSSINYLRFSLFN